MFSCLVASYNNAEYIEACLDSLFTQTYNNIEVVIVDDASTDESLSKIKKYTDPRLRIVENSENRGCGYTKARLVREANGEYCGFIDPDDLLAPNAVEEMVSKLNQSEEMAMAYSRYVLMDANGNFKNEKGFAKKRVAEKTHFEHHFISHFVGFKKSKYALTEGINPELKRAVDQDLYLKLEEVGTISFIDLPLYYYRNSPASISLNENEHKATYWEFKVHEATCQRRGIEPETHFSGWFARKINRYKEPFEKLQSSKEYRLGKKLLHPKQWLK